MLNHANADAPGRPFKAREIVGVVLVVACIVVIVLKLSRRSLECRVQAVDASGAVFYIANPSDRPFSIFVFTETRGTNGWQRQDWEYYRPDAGVGAHGSCTIHVERPHGASQWRASFRYAPPLRSWEIKVMDFEISHGLNKHPWDRLNPWCEHTLVSAPVQ
jgi:hypothetical protein